MRSELGGFDEFFRGSFASVVALLVKAGFGFDDSRDAVSEAMARACERWSELTSPYAWVCTTATRIAVNDAQRRREGVGRAVAAGWDASASPTDPYTAIDGYSEVRTVLAELPPQQRLVMAWLLHDFKPSEIAEYLDMAEATVRSHRRHALQRLRARFEGAAGPNEEVTGDGP